MMHRQTTLDISQTPDDPGLQYSILPAVEYNLPKQIRPIYQDVHI